MKRSRTWTGVLTVAAMAVFAGADARGEVVTVNGARWWYELEEGKATVTNGPIRGDVVIPSTLGGCPVTGIGKYAFKGCSGLTSVTIPKSVRVIDREAFAGCTGLTTVIIPEGVTRIGLWAFSGCGNLRSVRIPDSVTSMGSSVFDKCDDDLFDTTSRPGFTVVDGWVVRVSEWYDEESGESYYPNDFTGFRGIAGGACSSGKKSLTWVRIGNTVKGIGDGAFGGCTGLWEMTIPGNVKSIGDDAFKGCTGLASVTIENGVTSIGNSAFSGCTSLGLVAMENGVASIGDLAFKGCTSLSSVTIPDSVTEIGFAAFSNCYHVCETKLIPGVTVVDGWVVGSLTSLSGELDLTGMGLRGIADWAFANCTNHMTSVKIPGSVKTIGADAFANTPYLTSVTIENGVERIGRYAFDFSLWKASLKIPGSVTYIGYNAFWNNWLRKLYVPSKWKGTAFLKYAGMDKDCKVVYYETKQQVTFDANGGNCGTRTKEYSAGKTYGTLPTAVWAGHAFLGWWTAREGGTQLTSKTKVGTDGALTAYAHWTTTQTVSFNANGGRCGTGTKGYTIGEAYRDLPVATRKGQAFKGWWTAKTGGTKVTEGEMVVPEKALRTLYARWTKTQTVKFEGNGGTCKTKSKGYAIGKAYGSLPAASRAGHGFIGWADAAAGGTMVGKGDKATEAAGRTLWAQWTTRQRVSFNANGGACGTAEGEYGIGGVYGELPEAARAGRAFTGWWTAKTEGKKVVAGETAVTEAANRTLYARWTGTQTVKFDGNGGTCGTKSKGYTIGKVYGSLPTATRAGHGFVGWADAAAGGTMVGKGDKATETAGRTLYAQWTTRQRVAFHANGGECGTAEMVFGIGGTYGELPVATKAGQAFAGWYTAKTEGKKVSAGTTKVTEAASRTLYARWTKTQTVSFDGNGGTCKTKTKACTVGKSYGSLPVAAKAGFGFAGWASAPEGGEAVGAGDRVTEEAKRTLYARWTTNQVVSFDPNGGECVPGSAGFEIGKAYGELPVPTKAGSAFAGWYTAKKDGTKVTGASKATEAAARTLYAHWTTKQTAKFDANGGKCGTGSKTYTVGKTYGSLPTATWKGHVFLGWWDAAVGGRQVTQDDAVTEVSARTLYARWDDPGEPKIVAVADIAGFSVDTDKKEAGPGGVCTLQVETEAGVVYEVQWRAKLDGGEWTSAKRWTADADGPCKVEVPLPEGATGFFRLAAGE